MVLFMSRPTLAGRYRWQCFHQLAFIPELLGVDRRLLVLVFLLGFVIHVSTNLILFPVFLSVVMTLILRRMCKTDRQLMSVLQSAFRYPAAWYDPGLPPAKFRTVHRVFERFGPSGSSRSIGCSSRVFGAVVRYPGLPVLGARVAPPVPASVNLRVWSPRSTSGPIRVPGLVAYERSGVIDSYLCNLGRCLSASRSRRCSPPVGTS